MTLKIYDVRLDTFEGPMDLLLHLIRRSDLDICDIPVSQITSEYLAYVDLMQELNLEVAGEFLLMASTLMQIKAQMLLPKEKIEGEDGPDPRAELVNRLLEYQRYKVAAEELGRRYERFRGVHFKGSLLFAESDFALDASTFDLFEAFREALKEKPAAVREIVIQEIPIESKIKDILDQLDQKPYVTFRELLYMAVDRHGLIVTFLAVLELIRTKQVAARQAQSFGEIRVYRRREGEEVPAVIEDMTAASVLAPAPAGDPLARPSGSHRPEEDADGRG